MLSDESGAGASSSEQTDFLLKSGNGNYRAHTLTAGAGATETPRPVFRMIGCLTTTPSGSNFSLEAKRLGGFLQAR